MTEVSTQKKKGVMTREKEEMQLIKDYENILVILDKKQIDEGIKEIRILLQNKLIQEQDFKDLRRACYLSLANIYENEKKMYDEALHYYNKAILINNFDFQTWFKMGQLSRKQGFLPQSEQCLLQALQQKPSQMYENVIYEQLTTTSLLQERWENTIQKLDIMIQNGYKINENLYMKGFCLSKAQLNLNLVNSIQQSLVSSIPDMENFKKNIQLLQEYNEFKNMDKKNAFYDKLVLKEKQFTIYVDKLTWQNFLSIINEVLKLMLLAQNMKNISKKTKKTRLQPLLTYIKENQIDFNTTIILKEKRENINVPEYWTLGKVPKNHKKQVNTNQSNGNIVASQNQQQLQKNKINQTPQKLRVSSQQQSSNNNDKDQCLDLQIREIAKEQHIPIKQKLNDVYNTVYKNISQDAKEKFELNFKKLITNSTLSTLNLGSKQASESLNLLKIIQSKSNMEIESSAIKIPVTDNKTRKQSENQNNDGVNQEQQGNSQDQDDEKQKQDKNEEDQKILQEQQEKFTKFINDDFMEFILQKKQNKYCSIIQLVFEILEHFLMNKKFFNSENFFEFDFIPEFTFLKESLKFCPHPVLKRHSEQNRGLKELLMKILIKCQVYSPQFLKDLENMCQNHCEQQQIAENDKNKNEMEVEEQKQQQQQNQVVNKEFSRSLNMKQNMSLSIFEIILEYFQNLKYQYEQNNVQVITTAGANFNNSDLNRKRKKLDTIKQILKEIQFSFLFNTEDQPQVYKARAYYSLSQYFSELDFFNEEYAQQCAAKFKEIVDQIQDAEQSEQFKGYLLNVFWLDSIYVKMNYQDMLDNKIKDNNQKVKEIYEKFEKQKQTQNQILNNLKKQQQLELEKQKGAKNNNSNNPIIIIEDDDEIDMNQANNNSQNQEQQKLQEELVLKEQQRLEELENNKNQIDNLFKEFSEKIHKNSEDAFDLFYKKMHEMILKITDLKIIAQYYDQIFSIYLQCVYNNTLSQETTKNILNLDMKFKIDEINTHFQNRFYQQTEVKNVVSYDDIKDAVLNLNLNFLKILIIKLFYIDFESHSRWFRVYYITTKYLIKSNIPEKQNDKQQKEILCESGGNFLFFVHFLFHLHKNKDRMVELHTKFLQEKLFDQELTKAFGYLQQQQDDEEQDNEENMSDSYKNSLNDSEEDEDTDWDDNQPERVRVIEELRTFYKCCYGIKNRKKRQIQVYNDIINSNSSTWQLKKFTSFEEIKNLCNFIKQQYPEYIKDIQSTINGQVQILLIAIFEFMKSNDSDWAKCLGMGEKNKQFKRWVKDGDESIIEYIQQRKESQSEFCFCEKKNCLGDLMENNQLCDILFMVGRAHETFNVNEMKDVSEIQIQKNQKATLIKAEKMFILNILLKPQKSQVWQLLGGVYQQLTFIYFDNITNEPVTQKIIDIKDNFKYCKKLYNFIMENFKEDRLLINEIEEELTILNLLKFYERKVIYIASKPNGQLEQNPLDNDQVFQIKNKVTQIQEKMYEKNYNDKLIRKVYFQELFIFRSFKQCYSVDSIKQHFSRLLKVKNIVDNLKVIQKEDNDKDEDLTVKINKDFDGENYDVEFQMEYYISLYKIIRYYLNILKIYQENTYMGEESQKQIQLFKEKVLEMMEEDAFYNQIVQILENICEMVKAQDMSLLNEISAKNNDFIDINVFINKNKNNKKFDTKLYNKSFLFVEQIYKQNKQQQQEEEPKGDMEVEQEQKKQKIQIETPSKEEILKKQEQVIQDLSIIITNIGNNLYSMAMNRAKKHRYKRFFYRSILYSSKVIYSFDSNNDNSNQKALKNLQEIINQKSEDIVSMYTHTESQSIEKDSKFMYFFPRKLVFLVEKYKVIKQLIILYERNQEFEKMRLIFKKLLRMSIKKGEEIVDNNKEKDNKNKNQKDQEIQEVKFYKDRYNKIFQKLYLIAINITLDFFQDEMEKNPDCVKDTQNLPKQLHEIYTLNVKQKTQAKFLEENIVLQDKIKKTVVQFYKNSQNIDQKDDANKLSELELQTNSIKYIEDMFRKKKAPKNKKDNKANEKTDTQDKNEQENSN